MRLLYFLILLVSWTAAHGQGLRITGIISDDQQQGIAFATVVLMNQSDSSFVAGAVSDEEGQFEMTELSRGAYILQAKHLLYDLFSQSIDLQSNEQITCLLTSSTQQLETVEVTADKLSLQHQLNTFTINADQSAIASGGTVVDLLKSAPMLTVSPEGDISLRGRSDFQILINGRPSGLAALQGARFLAQLDASAVERVEIITQPSAKDNPQGGAGIINIVLKKETQRGGQISLETYVDQRGRYGIRPALNYRKDRINLFLNYSSRRNLRFSDSENTRWQVVDSTQTTIKGESEGERDDLRHRIELGTDYFLNDHAYFTLSGVLRTRDKSSEHSEERISTTNAQVTERRLTEIDEPEENEGVVVNLAFQSEPDQINKLQAFAEYLYSNEDEIIERIDIIDDQDFAGGRTHFKDFNQRIILDFALTRPLARGTYSLGSQWISRIIRQDFTFQLIDSITGSFKEELFQENVFDYEDNILSAYFQLNQRWSNWQFEVGLRVENMASQYGTEVPAGQSFTRSIFNLFPSAQLGFQLSDVDEVQFAYARQINRPSPGRLNPFVDISQPFRIALGNPGLLPEYIHSFNLGYLRSWERLKFSTNLFYKQYQGLIQRLSTLNANGIQIVQPVNLDRLHFYGLDATFSWHLLDFWKLSGGALAFQNDFSDESLSNAGLSYQLKLNQEWEWDEGWQIALLGVYQGPEIEVQGRQLAQYYFDLGLQKQWSSKLRMTLSISDIFNTLVEQSELRLSDLTNDSRRKIDTRRIRLTLRYKWTK